VVEDEDEEDEEAAEAEAEEEAESVKDARRWSRVAEDAKEDAPIGSEPPPTHIHLWFRGGNEPPPWSNCGLGCRV
jgi:hypothetical protein